MRYLIFILLVLVGFVAKSQTVLPANALPTQFSTGFFKHGWHKADSGQISAVRDTSFVPRYPGTRIMWQRAGIDTSEWFYTGRKWVRNATSTTIPSLTWGSINGTLSNQTDLQNALNLKFNTSDTTNKWLPIGRRKVDTIYGVNDSTIGFTINGTAYTFKIIGNGTGGGSYAGPFNAPAVGDTLVNSDKELKRLNKGFGILHNVTGINITQSVDTTRSTGLPSYFYVDSLVAASPGGGGIGGTIAAGQVAYGSGANTIAGNNNHWWDNTNVRLGIATNSPLYKLDIHDVTDGSGSQSILHLSAGTGDAGGYLMSFGGGTSPTMYMTAGAVINSTNTAWTAKASKAVLFGTFDGDARIYANTGLTPGNSFGPTERFTILGTNGNVGVNTTTPTSQFHVTGAPRFDLGSDANYDLLYRASGGAMARLAAGTDGQVLTTHGTSSAPTWETPSAAATTIYSGDGTLSGHRTVTGSNNRLLLDGVFSFRINSASGFIQSNPLRTRAYTSILRNTGDTAWWFGYTPQTGIFPAFDKGTAMIVDTNNNVGLSGAVPNTSMPLYTSGDGGVSVNGLLSIAGNFYKIRTITSNTTLGLDDYWINIDASGGAVTVTLPSASSAFGVNVGLQYVFKRVDNSGNAITIQRAGSDTIDSGTTFALNTQWEARELQCGSSSAWYLK